MRAIVTGCADARLPGSDVSGPKSLQLQDGPADGAVVVGRDVNVERLVVLIITR